MIASNIEVITLMKRPRMRGLIWGSALSLGLAGCGHTSSGSSLPSVKSPSSPSPSQQAAALDPLTGQPSSHNGPLVAVMVENSEYGRPQAGLTQADVVYEAYTEKFYYPRYMLLFWGKAPHTVGPVRSARPYFVSWVQQWNAAYARAGGSNQADAMLATDGVHDMDKITLAPFLYWRDPHRNRPHNLFTNVAKLMAYADKKWGNPTIAPHWQFRSRASTVQPPYTTLRLTWNNRNSIEEWQWDAKTREWLRYVQCPVCSNAAMNPVIGVNTGHQVSAANVVIQYANSYDTNDAAGHIEIATSGSGKALLFLGGRYYQGTWQQSGGPTQPTQYFLANGQPAQFKPGPTWIEVVPYPNIVTPFQLQMMGPPASP